MKETENRLVEWAINKAKTCYRDDVSILLEHNTYCLEKDRHVRYVNTIISDTRPYIGMARTFIIDGIGYDINQVSWDSFERDADLKGFYTTVLAEAKILYSKNEADEQRFLYLRAKMKANLANPHYMHERALDWLNKAMDIYKTMMFQDTLNIRRSAGDISCYLGVAIACFNQRYFSGFNQLQELSTMKNIPEYFVEIYNQIINAQSADELKILAHKIIATTKNFLEANDNRTKKITVNHDFQYLADWYQECSYYFRRIYHFCGENRADLAFHLSNGIQTDLDEIAQDYKISDLGILDSFDANDLAAYAKRVKLAEERIVSTIESNGVKIDTYVSVEEFISKNK